MKLRRSKVGMVRARVAPGAESREMLVKQMKSAENIIRRYRNALRELAK
jgi:hypothetical protein